MMNFLFENVERAYTGGPGCMCGCQGKYSDGGTRSAKIIFNKLMKNPLTRYDESANCAWLRTETRQLVVYFKEWE